MGCHGPLKQKGEFRIDTLDPNLLKGKDVKWWLEVFDVISNGEMPPEDVEEQLADTEKASIIDWLSKEIQTASQVRRIEKGHTSFRRMTRYEYKYVLQDLLGVPLDFSRDLPPETSSEDGFKNSSEMLQMTAVQFEQYRQIALKALKQATVRGERPKTVYYGISMKAAAKRINAKYSTNIERTRELIKEQGIPFDSWWFQTRLEEAIEKQTEKFPRDHNGIHYRDLVTGQGIGPRWSYNGAKYAWTPTLTRPEVPTISPDVIVIPANARYIVDLGDGLPDSGNMRVRIRAAQYSAKEKHPPTLRLYFGNQASNDSRVAVRAGGRDITVTAHPDKPEFYHWDIPLSEITRNAYRHITKLGDLPNPAEFLSFHNDSSAKVAAKIDYIEIIAPTFKQWPPESHSRIFFQEILHHDEEKYAAAILTSFMSRAWRKQVTKKEVDQKLSLFIKLRPSCKDFQEAIIEVLSAVLSSPKFLYVVQNSERNVARGADRITDFELASRLSFFLWSSTPDTELLSLAKAGKLRNPEILQSQTLRLLTDSKVKRFTHHFTRQWLGLELLDFLKIDSKAFLTTPDGTTKNNGRFDPLVLESMRKEPVAFFEEILKHNHSIMDFLHSDYIMANDRLAEHYKMPEVIGNELRAVKLRTPDRRGGVLTQAGLLAMNSDGKDSHPLKRGIWLLENLLNDPPPPPPPAVPEIDLADPEIMKLTLKQRMASHRDDPACLSCHAKIDPWGIAFENYDALGRWRNKIGNNPVDAKGILFNKYELKGMQGLKAYLLNNRQEQFTRALTHKLAAYALGRPLNFGDRSRVDLIASNLQKKGSGLRDLVILIVKSDLFQLK
ncbi:MAG: DUF1592 domain-containing protein [Verrucomicrobiota bacterium]|nr:DUF1592 domain-containing protein [Verrucomicrobiota bacterium]